MFKNSFQINKFANISTVGCQYNKKQEKQLLHILKKKQKVHKNEKNPKLNATKNKYTYLLN